MHKIITLLLGFTLMTAILNTVLADDRVLNINEYTSATGLTYWHVEDHSLPILALHFAFKGSGSVNDPVDKTGLAQLVSNTMDEGAGKRDANQFQEDLQNNAIDLSFNSSRDFFTGKLKTIKRHQDLAFEMVYDAIHTPRFDDEAISRMRQANIMRIKSSQSKPNWLASRLMNDVYFGDHPYTRNAGGTISGLNAITSMDMQGFVRDNFNKNRLVIATAGDMTAEEAGVIIDKIFADLPDGEKTNDLNLVAPPEKSMKIAFETDSPQSVVQMIWPAISKDDPDYHAYSIMNYILGGGGFSSMLMDEVREKQGLTYGIYSQPVHMQYADYITIESATSPENILPMTASVQGVLKQLTTETISKTVLKDAKSYLIGSLPLRFSSTLSLSGTAIRMQLDGRPLNALDMFADKVSAVSVEDVQRVAQRIFKSLEPTVTVITGAVPEDQNFELVDSVVGIE